MHLPVLNFDLLLFLNTENGTKAFTIRIRFREKSNRFQTSHVFFISKIPKKNSIITHKSKSHLNSFWSQNQTLIPRIEKLQQKTVKRNKIRVLVPIFERAMLHRSFKPAKCKTALKLAVSRIKLLRNKRDAQVKQLKRELAQLLESGQDRTARIRVEHVVREEKTVAAYDLIEIYCELIAARLPIIESQKNCPIDLKEAIASVIFASPRCADLPELMDIRKHLTAKYGKEFISAAVELRPDCGVGRMLVEKLSAKAPDGQTKIKILSAIAEEHNIKWDPKSFEEKELKPPEDLLNGPNTFEKASKMYVEPPNVQVPPNQDEKHDVSVKSYDRDARSSLHSQNFASTDIGGNETTASANYHPELKPSGSKTEGMEFMHSYSGDGNSLSLGRQNWNMEFKDATAAAQAAAESAERASMAARAAAELSSRGKITGNYYTESQKPSASGLRDERPRKYDASKSQGEHLAKDPVDTPHHERNPRTQNEQMYGNEEDNKAEVAERYYRDGHRSTKKSSRSASSKFSTASTDEHLAKDPVDTPYHERNPRTQNEQMYSNEQDNKAEVAERYYRDGHASTKKSSRSASSKSITASTDERLAKYPVDTPYHERNPRTQNEQMYGNEQDNKAEVAERYYRDGHGSTKKSSRSASSKSSTASTDDETLVNILQNADRYSVKDLPESAKGESEVKFVSEPQDDFKSQDIDYLGDVRIRKQPSTASLHSHSDTSRHTEETKSFDNAAVFFDDSGSDNEDCRFDIEDEYKGGQASSLCFSSPGRKSPTHVSANTSAWSHRQNANESVGTISQSHISTEWCSPHVFSASSTSSVVPSQADEPLPATFDDSDVPSSESEEELDRSKLLGSEDPSIFPRKPNVYSRNSDLTQGESHEFIGSSFTEKGNGGSNRKPWLQSSSDDLDLVEVRPDRNQGIEYSAEPQKKIGFGDSPTSQPSPRVPRHRLDSSDMNRDLSNNQVGEGDRHLSEQRSSLSLVNEVKDNIYTLELPDTLNNTEVMKESSLESGKELNFGTLTGGLRNKGYRRPPYTRSSSGDVLSSKQAAEDTSIMIEQSSSSSIVKPSISSESHKQEVKNQKVSSKAQKKPSSRASVTYFDPDDDDFNEELPQQTFSGSQEPYNQKLGTEVNKSSLRGPITYFDSDQDDSEEDLPKQTAAEKARSGTGFSRRTKVSSLNADRSSYSKATVLSKVSMTADYDAERKSSSRSSHATETLAKPRFQTENSVRGSSERPGSAEQAASKPFPEPTRSSHEDSLKSSAREQWSNSLPKIVTSRSTESSKPSSSSGAERKSSSRSSYATETLAKPRFQTESSVRGSSERPGSAEHTASKPFPESKRSSHDDSLKSSARKQQSNSLPKIVTAGSTENSKTSSSSGETPSKENSIKQASHVHPKLPDYDTLTAHLQSLRMNRQ